MHLRILMTLEFSNCISSQACKIKSMFVVLVSVSIENQTLTFASNPSHGFCTQIETLGARLSRSRVKREIRNHNLGVKMEEIEIEIEIERKWKRKGVGEIEI